MESPQKNIWKNPQKIFGNPQRRLLEECLAVGAADGELLELGGELGEVGVVVGVQGGVDVVGHATSTVSDESRAGSIRIVPGEIRNFKSSGKLSRLRSLVEVVTSLALEITCKSTDVISISSIIILSHILIISLIIGELSVNVVILSIFHVNVSIVRIFGGL